jgi:uncharacterized membrane protein
LNEATRAPLLSRSRWFIPALLLLIVAIHEGIYLAVTPLWQGPDEPRHFEYVAQIAGGISPDDPSAFELQRRIIESMQAHDFWTYGYAIAEYDPAAPPQVLDDIWPGHAHQTHQPPLYYRLAGALIRFSGELELEMQLWVVRGFSALLGAGVVLAAWATAHTLFPRKVGLAFLIGLFVALLPMHAFMNTVANNDNLASLLTALAVLLSARVMRFGARWPDVVGGLAIAILAVTAKRTGMIAPAIWVMSLLAACWDHIGRALRGRPVRRIAAGGAALLILLLAGAWLFGDAARRLVVNLWTGFLHLPPDVLDLLLDGSYGQALLQTPYPYYTRMVFESFWARFGWLNVRLPDVWYVLLGALCALAGAGIIRYFFVQWRQPEREQPYQRRAMLVFALIAVANYVFILGKEVLFLSHRTGVTPQGRYMFPVVIPLAFLLVLGLRELVPVRWRTPAAYVGAASLAFFDAICIIVYVMPYYSS